MQAVPFCFGPTSTNLAIATELRKMNADITWLAEGTALNLLRAGGYADQVIEFSLSNNSHKRQYASLIKQADIVIVNTDPDFAEFSLELNEKTVYVDILYWMWNSLPPIVHKCALYVYEDFVRSDEQIKRIGLPSQSFRVGHLTNLDASMLLNCSSSIGDHLLISLGGLLRPSTASYELLLSFKEMIWSAVIMALEKTNNFTEVYFASGGIKSEETTLSNGIKILSGCFSREEHQKKMLTAKAVVMSPGLTGFYEVVTAQTPVFFLPPHNYSQHLQLQSYKNFLLRSYYSDWSRLGIMKEMQCFLPEEQMLDEVDKTLTALLGKSELLSQHLLDFFNSGWKQHNPRPALDLLKMLEDRNPGGAKVAAQTIFNLCR